MLQARTHKSINIDYVNREMSNEGECNFYECFALGWEYSCFILTAFSVNSYTGY